jgi:hypothetical protein
MKLKNGQDKSKIALNGRILLGRPRVYRRCSAIEEDGGCKHKHKRSETVSTK